LGALLAPPSIKKLPSAICTSGQLLLVEVCLFPCLFGIIICWSAEKFVPLYRQWKSQRRHPTEATKRATDENGSQRPRGLFSSPLRTDLDKIGKSRHREHEKQRK